MKSACAHHRCITIFRTRERERSQHRPKSVTDGWWSRTPAIAHLNSAGSERRLLSGKRGMEKREAFSRRTLTHDAVPLASEITHA